MGKRTTIVLVEDDPAACQRFERLIEASDDFALVGVTNNAAQALTYLRDTLPGVLILDLELHLGGGNGLQVLQGMQQMALAAAPFVVITTNNCSQPTYERARQLGADFILFKHQTDYSEQYVLDFLRLMGASIQTKRQTAGMAQATTEAPAQQQKRITRRIMSELNAVGISPKAVGYAYLVDAIEIVMQKPTQNLSSIIGQKHGKTECSVERAMKNAIDRAWKVSAPEDLLRHYTAHINPDKGVPSITEFVYYYPNKLNTEY